LPNKRLPIQDITIPFLGCQKAKMARWITALFLVAIHASNAVAQLATPQQLLTWGESTYQSTVSTLQVPGTALYAENAALGGGYSGGDSGFSYVWDASVQFRVLDTLTQVNPTTYAPILQNFSTQLYNNYWNASTGGYRSGVSAGATEFYDDNGHLAVALATAYNVTGNPTYLNQAKATYSFVRQGMDNVGGGGIYFKVGDFSSKDTATTLQGAHAALLLYQDTGVQSYLTDATSLYNWAWNTTQRNNLFYERLYLTGSKAGTVGDYQLVNSAGFGLDDAMLLFKATGNATYFTEAENIAAASIPRYFNATTGAINDEGYWDFELANALDDLYKLDHNKTWLNDVNRALVWLDANRQDPNGHYGTLWGRGGTQVGALSSWDLIDQAAVAQSYLYAYTVAAPSSWTGASSTNWADSGNWSGAVPGATAGTTNTDTATFNQNAPNSQLTIDAGRNIQDINFDTANLNSLTIGMVGGNALLLTAGGTIQTTSTVTKSQAVNAPLVLEGNYTFTSGASSSSATLGFGGGITPAAMSGVTTLTLNGSNTGANTISGILADNGTGQLAVSKSGSGTWILSGANTYSGSTTVSGGTLKFAINSGVPTIAAGAVATVTASATLELAGSVSALGSVEGIHEHIVNTSTAPGLVVSGTHQIVGNIDGSGTTQVNAGSDLTANHIIQSVLIIGGTSTSHGLMTIDASDSAGNPLGQSNGLALGGSLVPSDPFGAGSIGPAGLSSGGGNELASLSPSSSVGNGNPSSVPEPSTLLLVLLAIAGSAGHGIALRRRARRNDY
jgi:autotransporter-associated beta strand protein